MDDALSIHRNDAQITAYQNRLAVLAEVGSRLRYLQLKLAIGRYGELAACTEGLIVLASRQFHVQAASNYVHDFQLIGTELVISRGHDANGGRSGCHIEGNGFDGAVEVLVDLEHSETSEGAEKGGQYAEAMWWRHHGRCDSNEAVLSAF